MKTWTLKVETMSGAVKVLKVKALNLDKAIDAVCREVSVANILETRDGYKVRWL